MADQFKERETQFEAKFAHDEELRFKAIAHRDRLFAAWVAEQMGSAAPADYAETLREYAFGRKPDALVARALQDLKDKGVTVSEVKAWRTLEHCLEVSVQEVLQDEGSSG
jgi:hypothetical protein